MLSNSPSSTTAAWPGRDGSGLRIGEAAALLDTTVKAIRVYHEHGVVPEPGRDDSGYRRYDAGALVRLARVLRLRAVGLALREIRPVLEAGDGAGAALQATLRDLAETLDEEIAERRQRRALIGDLLDEGITDPLAVSAADVAEERQIAFLRRHIPDLSPEEEAFERRMQRALGALGLTGAEEPTDAEAERLLAATGGAAQLVDRHRRLFALRDAAPDDPRVDALVADMRRVMQVAVEGQAEAAAADAAVPTPRHEELEQLTAGLRAALSTLPPAVRRVWERVLLGDATPMEGC
jgi:DNA-binding transcriptional MerR regulator